MTVKRLQRRIAKKQRRLQRIKARRRELDRGLATDREKLARLRAVRWGHFFAAHEATIHYDQARPTPQYRPGTERMTLDCSGACETIARWSGLPDPSGLGWGNGNTDSMLKTLRAVPKSKLLPGDYALWHNGSDGLHVATVIDVTDTDVRIVSHGQEAGPTLYWLSSYAHDGELTFLGAIS